MNCTVGKDVVGGQEMLRENIRSRNVEARDLPTKAVVVYGDRAEVKRVAAYDLEAGRNEIVIQNVSAVIERQSLRVEALGTAAIQEVQFQEIPVDSLLHENDKVRELEQQKNELEFEKSSVDDQLNVLKKRVEVLDGVAGQISHNVVPTSSPIENGANGTTAKSVNCNGSGFFLSEDIIANLTRFLDFYGETASDLKAQIRKKTKQADLLSEKVDLLERHIDQLRCGSEYDSIKRNISIVVDVEQAGFVELHVSYQVYCASWKPTYDIRVDTATDDVQKNILKVCYYGLIEQNTGEDWRAAELVLSTATPSVGGSIPALFTLAAEFQKQQKSLRQRNGSSRRKPNSAVSDEDMGFGSYDYNDFTDAAALQRLTAAAAALPNSDFEHSLASSYEHLPSTCFAIARPATIVSDGSEHKVTVVQVELEPKFLHETVPARSAAAYLTAVATNTSTFPFLPGPASVYLNNSFVAKTQLSSVAPGEEFCCSLGVDSSVKVEYKPAVRFHEQIGFVTKSSLQTHDQAVSIRNAKAAQSVQITVREHVPKSTDDKIKIGVLSPDLRSSKGEARLNKDHNLEWTITLTPGEQRELHVKWTIEYPLHETIAYRTLQSTVHF